MLKSGGKFDIDDFERMQQDTVSLEARDFLRILKDWHPAEESQAANIRSQMLNWNCNVAMDSKPAVIFEVWMEHLHRAIIPKGIASTRLSAEVLLREVKASADRDALLSRTLDASMTELRERLGQDQTEWKWGSLHKVNFHHPLRNADFDLPSLSRPGDAYTVNATSGLNYLQTSGASYREILDVSDWDRSVTTNTPGESGNPGDRHYGDLERDWASGTYHPLPYSRKAVEAAAEERTILVPSGAR
jgi:penicillin amidase